ncbi:DJ-1/PfpI family protein [Martelella endophytica]|uniref:Thiamine biosynthesis protein ThiJ n=1 Tax=Martelella endophytica TaxID=1486262 RepID=A0A0D5LRZ1_MAREN|nr:DJ-1/PfpI family protein [Martelella endophytica]AJY46735.1 thiamine biosynthesis protein ThiJ [Martelella endophytica]
MPASAASCTVGFILYPGFTQLDLFGPADVLNRMQGVEVKLLWKNLDPVIVDRGLRILPNMTFGQCESLDIICVPGGPGQIALMDDDETLNFLRRIAPGCKLVTSVCTGSLVLGAAGLLKGYKATSHWTSLDHLSLFGATPVEERVVIDRNRITGAGVTSGIDFALKVVEELSDRETAQRIQLQMEYDPQPPYNCGSPKTAPPEIVDSVRARLHMFQSSRRSASERAAERLNARKG